MASGSVVAFGADTFWIAYWENVFDPLLNAVPIDAKFCCIGFCVWEMTSFGCGVFALNGKAIDQNPENWFPNPYC